MQVIFSPQADADLRSAVSYIFDENPSAAERLLSDIELFCFSTLAEFPKIGAVFREPVRVFYKRGYRIFYELSDEQVTILRIVHAAQDDYSV